MAGLWQKTKEYLGLADDDSYDYEPYEDAYTPPPPGPGRRVMPVQQADLEPVSAVRAAPASDSGVGAVVAQPRPTSAASPQPSSVRTVTATPIPAPPKVHVVAPMTFGEAQEIGERFRSAQPVIVNLTAVDRDLARRLVDFASGLTYGLNGSMKKVADKVFMLTPANVEVSADERRRLAETGLLS